MTETRDLYRAAGVNIAAGHETVDRIKPHVARTWRKEVLGGIGGFGGGFALDVSRYREPVLVSGTDGVGTKLKVAFALGKHDTVGVDAVAMCVNDILAMGAEPLYFLDYFATGKLVPAVAEQVVKGIADGCEQAGAALIGGETAEMPSMYADGEYDIAGFAVGVVERSRMVDGTRVRAGDVLVGLPSSGPHSNGFSLIRRLVADAGIGYGDRVAELDGTVGEALLVPTRIYVRAVRALLERFDIHGMAHVTGGGLLDNIPRVIPDGLGCTIDPAGWPLPPVLSWLRKLADGDQQTFYRTFNMGVGFVLIVASAAANDVLAALASMGEPAYVIGAVQAGVGGVAIAGSAPA
ncbi:MAG: phosphoribosylformylglycinamidine cyclo-ligase [Bacilli bacterium]